MINKTLHEIINLPVIVRISYNNVPSGYKGDEIQESEMRYYWIVQKVKELLKENLKPSAIIEIIELLESGDKENCINIKISNDFAEHIHGIVEKEWEKRK